MQWKLHAQTVDGAIKRLGKRLAGLRYAKITAKGPVESLDRYSPIYSLWTERDEASRFKLLVPNGLTEADLDAALGAYLIFIEAYHTGTLEAEDLEILAEARPVAGVVLLAYDGPSGSIQLIDPLEGRRH